MVAKEKEAVAKARAAETDQCIVSRAALLTEIGTKTVSGSSSSSSSRNNSGKHNNNRSNNDNNNNNNNSGRLHRVVSRTAVGTDHVHRSE